MLLMLLWPIIIIALIVFVGVRLRRRRGSTKRDSHWYLRPSLSREDAVSQFFYLLAIIFLGITLGALNRDLGSIFSWRIILFLTSIIGLVGAYYFKALYSLVVSVIGVVIWWVAEAAYWSLKPGGSSLLGGVKPAVTLSGFLILSLAMYIIGYIHNQKFKRFGVIYTMLGLIFVTGTLFILSTEYGLRMLNEAMRGLGILSSWQLVFSLLIFVALLTVALLYGTARKLIFISEVIAAIFLALFFLVLALVPEQNMYADSSYRYLFSSRSASFSFAGYIWATILNILVFLEILGIIFSGYIRREEWLVNLGAFFLFILIIVKYFDWFYSFLDKSFFFISAGVLLFVVGWFMEKGRRYMIKTIKAEAVPNII